MNTLSTRSARRAALASIAAGGLLAAAVVAAPAAAAAGATFTQDGDVSIRDQFIGASNAGAITIPASGAAVPYPSQVTVSGQPGTITDVNLSLFSFDHTFPDDVDVLLVGPGGQQATVLSDAGSDTDVVNVNLTFDDEAAAPLTDSGAITSGTYQPSNFEGADPFSAPAPIATGGSALSEFDGTSPNGTWSLYVVDDTIFDSGDISGGWSLTIEQTPNTAPYPSTLAVSGLPKGITDLDVSLSALDHTFPDDVDVMLVGPGGQRVVLLSDAGGGADIVNGDVRLDDEAASPVPDDGPLVSGTFRPTNYGAAADTFPVPAPDPAAASATLAGFDGTDPNGTWQLFVDDDAGGDVGVLGGWSLHVSTVDVPAAPTIATPGNGTTDNDGTITFTGTAQAGSTVRVLEGAAERAASTASGSGAWSVSLTGVADGPHTFAANATDAFGNTSPASSPVTVTVDTVAPGGSIVINGGAARTNSTLLTLTLSAADPAPGTGVTQMRFSNDGTSFSAFEPLAVTKSWTLPTSTNGTRTVWAQFADRAGKVSATVADSIILDTVKPRVSKIKPLKGATGVKVGVNVRAFFSEAMAAGTMTKANVKLVKAGTTKAIKATISYDAAKRKVTINPKKNLKHGTTYKVTIGTGVKDLAGNNLDQKPKKSGNQPMKWKFTTG